MAPPGVATECFRAPTDVPGGTARLPRISDHADHPAGADGRYAGIRSDGTSSGQARAFRPPRSGAGLVVAGLRADSWHRADRREPRGSGDRGIACKRCRRAGTNAGRTQIMASLAATTHTLAGSGGLSATRESARSPRRPRGDASLTNTGPSSLINTGTESHEPRSVFQGSA